MVEPFTVLTIMPLAGCNLTGAWQQCQLSSPPTAPTPSNETGEFLMKLILHVIQMPVQLDGMDKTCKVPKQIFTFLG